MSNIELNSFANCKNLKAIYVPENNVDYYKERFSADKHWLIVEEGSDLSAKDISFAPTLRVVVPKGESEDYILSVAKKQLERKDSQQLVRWIFDHLDTIADSKEPYSEKDR